MGSLQGCKLGTLCDRALERPVPIITNVMEQMVLSERGLNAPPLRIHTPPTECDAAQLDAACVATARRNEELARENAALTRRVGSLRCQLVEARGVIGALHAMGEGGEHRPVVGALLRRLERLRAIDGEAAERAGRERAAAAQAAQAASVAAQAASAAAAGDAADQRASSLKQLAVEEVRRLNDELARSTALLAAAVERGAQADRRRDELQLRLDEAEAQMVVLRSRSTASRREASRLTALNDQLQSAAPTEL